MARVRIINGKGDWGAEPPTGADDHDLQTFLNDFVSAGGVLDLSGGDALVAQSGTPGMSVQVAPGTIYVENSSWSPNSLEPRFYVVVRDSATTAIAISSNPSGSTRFDLVCQEIDKVTSPNDTASNICPITVVAGTPGAGIPSTPNDMELLAVIEVASGETSITTGDISDERRRVQVNLPAFQSPLQEVADGATITFDLEDGTYNKFLVAITAARTLAVSNVPVGIPFMISIQQDGGGGDGVTWWSNILWQDGEAPDFSGSADGAYDTFGFIKMANGDYQGFVVGQNLQ